MAHQLLLHHVLLHLILLLFHRLGRLHKVQGVDTRSSSKALQELRRVDVLSQSFGSHTLGHGLDELHQGLAILATTHTIETSHHSGEHKALRQGRYSLGALQQVQLSMEVGGQQLHGEVTVDSTELFVQLLLHGLDFAEGRAFGLTGVKDQEGVREASREVTNHLLDGTEVGGLANLNHAHIIRAALNNRAILSPSQGGGLSSGGGADCEDHLRSCSRTFHQGLHQSFEGLEVSEELFDSGTTIILTVHHVEP